MSLRFVETTVEIGGVSYGTLDPGDRLAAPTAWSPARIRWGYEDTLDDPEPSSLNLRVTIPDAATPPRYGDLIRITTRPQLRYDDDSIRTTLAPLVVFLGNVDGATRRRVNLAPPRAPRVDGWAFDLTASGSFAAVQRTMLADVPWPQELLSERLPRLQALLADRFTVQVISGPDYYLRARDVDNFPALEAIRRAIAPRGRFLTETTHTPGVFATSLRLTSVLRPGDDGQAYITDSNLIRAVPAAIFADQDRALDVQTIINSGAITYWTNADGGTERTYAETNAESVDTYGQSQYRTTSDGFQPNDAMQQTITRLLAARAAETWRLAEPLELVLENVPATVDLINLAPYLISPSEAGSGLFRITDPPPDIDPLQRIIGGELTLHGDHTKQAVSINVEPPATSLATASIPVSSYSTVTWTLQDFPISSLQNITFNDLRTIDILNI